MFGVVLLVLTGLQMTLLSEMLLEPPPESGDSTLAALLSITGAAIAMSSLCFSYSRAAEPEAKQAGLDTGRMFLGATILLVLAMAGYFATDSTADWTELDRTGRFLVWFIANLPKVGVVGGLLFALVAITSLSMHLIELAFFPHSKQVNGEEGVQSA